MAAQLQLRNAGCHGFGAVKDRAGCGKLAMGFRSINRAMMLLKKRCWVGRWPWSQTSENRRKSQTRQQKDEQNGRTGAGKTPKRQDTKKVEKTCSAKAETIIAHILALFYSCHKTIMKITLNLEEWHLREYSFCYINDCFSWKRKKKSHHWSLLSFDGQPRPNS